MRSFDWYTIDFETRSETDIKLGAAKYAEHPSTEVLMMCYSDGEAGDHVSDWLSPVLEPYGIDPSNPPVDLFDWIKNGGKIEAHNSFFERMIWRHKMVKLYGWPDIPDNQWRCSAAKAAAVSLPRGLGKAAQIMRCDAQKDGGGHQLMLRLCKPRGAWKKWDQKGREGIEPEKYFGSKEEFLRELEYCRDDVRTEKALSRVIPDLSELEWRIWEVDQAINERGIPLDLDMAHHILDMIERYKIRQREQLMALTDGMVERETKRNDLKKWFELQDYPIENTQADTLRDIAEKYPYDVIGHVSSLVRELNKSSTSKYKAMIARASTEDNRARDNLMYHGAGTGRWCLTGDHEVLTDSGWTRLDEWSGGNIACWKNDVISFKHADANSFEAPEALYSMNSQRIDQLSTGEHKMPYWTIKNGTFSLEEVTNLPTRFKIPFHGRTTYSRAPNPWKTRMLVAVQGDGHYLEDGSIRFHLKKQRKIDRLKLLCRRLGIQFSERRTASDTSQIVIPSRALPIFLKMFHNKTFGSWIWHFDPVVFFEELEFWDGYRCGPNSIQYCTTNKTNADLVQAFAHMNSMSAVVKTKKKSNPNWSTAYNVDIWLTPGFGHQYTNGVKEVKNHGFDKVYCPTTPTGMFLVRRNGKVWVTGNSGKGIQFQNLTTGKISDMEAAVEEVMDQNLSLVIAEHDDPMTLFSGLVRGAIKAPEGKELSVADFSSIEARGIMWASGEQRGLKIFEAGEDIYCDMATDIYNKPVIANPDRQPKERKLGKQAILGCGYQMGASKFLVTCEKYRINFTPQMIDGILSQEKQDEIEDNIRSNPIFYFPDGQVVEERVKPLILSKHIVNSYRTSYPAIPEFWKNLEEAAIEAVLDHQEGGDTRWVRAGPKMEYGNHYYRVIGKFLFCRLPSKRFLAYPFPRAVWKPTKWGSEKLTLTYKGVDSFTKKWTTQMSYGGKLAENNVQGFCRDITAEAMLRLEEHPIYMPILSVHDEILNENDEGEAFTEELEWIMSQRPDWCPNFPIDAEGWIGKRYRK